MVLQVVILVVEVWDFQVSFPVVHQESPGVSPLVLQLALVQGSDQGFQVVRWVGVACHIPLTACPFAA